MRVLEKSRKKVRPGDIFAFQMPDGLFRFGRVIRTDATVGGFPNCVLIYVYRPAQMTKLPIPPLRKSELLVAPLATNRQPWLKGYFQTMERGELNQHDILECHCFWDPARLRYVNDDGRVLAERIEPCGFDGLGSYRTIDDEISKALGIALAPD